MKDKNQILEIDKTSEGILRLLLNDPKNKNALSDKMIVQLKEQLSKASTDNSIKVIVIAAVGDVFCSGHNLKELTDARSNEDDGKSYFLDLFNLCSSLMQMIISCSKPVIAEINGIATAAGCQLVASCDLAIASEASKFATPGVNIGLFCSTPMVALSRNLSNKHSMEMLLTGELISSEKAEKIGLINKAMNDSTLKKYTSNMALKISKKSSSTLKIGKEAFYKQINMNLLDAYNYASEVMVHNMLNTDAKEGISAFLDKRTPEFKGK